VPLTASIAAGFAIVSTVALVAALWFDRLFEAPTAAYVPSLVQHLGSRSILAVFAHPDDETLAAGVLADAGSREGIDVRTITLTRGENGQSAPSLSRREDLPLVRESELRRYGFALGIDHQELWKYPDGELDGVSREVVDRLVERIRTWKPDFVLTFDPAGGYNWHRDHRAAGTLATEAVRVSADPVYRPEFNPAHRTKQMGYLIAPARALSIFGGPGGRAVAEVQPKPNLSVPVASSLRILGWRTHASQRLDKAYPLPGWLLFDFWDKEHYFVFEPGLRSNQSN